ncbi:class A beta-lactamase [Bradyrhizobium sp. STM 3562]|uniref:class A beta-lactamase n=1 Tax=Bradyrhizobium sp. STM 3562 TaxID=578924 RepID=UPI00388DE086
MLTTDWRRFGMAAETGFARLPDAFAKAEVDSGGRLGVTVLDTGDGTAIGHHENERFPMCSTFKVLAAAAVLSRIDAGEEQIARRIRVAPGDLLAYAPVTKQHVGADMSVADLCEAALTLSDNTAANLLLASLGGPSAVTQYARALGDDLTRLDRIEPDLNTADPGDLRDTTTPLAMARDLAALATGTALSPASRELLINWLVGCKTGDAKLRAGLPKTWRVGDKTGSGAHGTSNDVAVIWPPGRAPLIIAVYLTETALPDDKRNASFAAIGRAVAAALPRQ